MDKDLERFIRYVKIDTQSSEDESKTPSSEKQWNLANLLVDELEEMGVNDVNLDKNCIITATIPSNTDEKVPVIGFIAHMDTALDLTGTNVKPQIVENYDGKDIKLNDKYTLSPTQFPSLFNSIGHKLVTTSGDTLLGADDKAGITVIMGLIEYLINHPEVKHGAIKIAFTPDEEVGRGTENFDIKSFGADFAYTIDGSSVNEIEYECFNAASADVYFTGVSIHPGSAKDIMINALHLAMEFHSLLPKELDPALTEGYEGFNHLTDLNGGVSEAHSQYIIRNHDYKLLEKQKEDFMNAAAILTQKYQYNCVNLLIKDSYRNMKDYLTDKMFVVDYAKQAIKNIGYTPVSNPIRGGTDGANLTFRGLPCPNLGTGGYNCHGRYEYLDLNELKDCIKIALEIIKIVTNQ